MNILSKHQPASLSSQAEEKISEILKLAEKRESKKHNG
jgi:hypothetical protein